MSWSDIPGRAAYLWIYDEFIETAPIGARVVEVGVALGKSVAYLARRCMERGRKDIRIYAVDAWAGVARNGEQQEMGPPDGDYELFQRMMETHAPAELGWITPIREWSVSASKGFADASLDLVVLDADHAYEAVRADLAAWVPKVKPGGVIGGDDWMPDFPGVERAVRERFADRTVITHTSAGHVITVRHEHDWGTWRVAL